jgi:PKHD-type hydroxylase
MTDKDYFADVETIGDHKLSQSHITFNNIIPAELINMIRKEIDSIQDSSYEIAKTGTSNEYEDTSIRRSTINWIDEMHWITSIFHHYMKIANREIWEYDITGCQSIQVTRYTKGGHYTWHCDYGVSEDVNDTRKLSASLLLSNPDDYVGGKFQLIDYQGKVISIPKKQGQITFFDARIPHRVAPILKGERISLVAWFTGPKLK